MKNEAADYLGENDAIGEFLESYFVKTGNRSDKVPLREMFNILRSDSALSRQLGFTISRQLSQKLKMKNIIVEKTNGEVCVRCFKFKDEPACNMEM